MLEAAHRLKIPVTPRGAGTGNYGQAMPLTGGVLVNLIEMNKVLTSGPGRVVCEPGALIGEVDKATAASGQELRMFPSTRATATIAGFVAGGSGGVGSITWGGLRDFGNVLRLRVMTMEASPRTLELTGEDLHKAVHAYGTNGIITEVEMPLTPRYDWVEAIVGFDSFDAATAYALALGEQDGILKKLVTVVAAPAPHDYFLRHRALIPAGKSVVLTMIAPHALDAFEAFTRPAQRREILFNSSQRRARDAGGPAADLRTRLEPHDLARRCASIRPSPICRRAIRRTTRSRRSSASMTTMAREVIGHLELIRFNGRIGFRRTAAWCASRPRSGSTRSWPSMRRWAR